MKCIHCEWEIETNRTDEHKAVQNIYGEYICEACENNLYTRCKECGELAPTEDAYNEICMECDIELSVPYRDKTGRVI